MRSKIFIFSILLNMLLSGGFIAKKLYNKINYNHAALVYNANEYKRQTQMFDLYSANKSNIVMIGDSLTYNASWHEVNGAINRGIRGDYIEGAIKRLPQIYQIKPKKAFIMTGINNFMWKNDTPEEVFRDYKKLLEKLRQNNIEPIVQSCLYIGTKRNNYKNVNRKVKKLNDYLARYATQENIRYIDLNKYLSKNNLLIDNYTVDGVHLNAAGYKLWFKAIQPYSYKASIESSTIPATTP